MQMINKTGEYKKILQKPLNKKLIKSKSRFTLEKKFENKLTQTQIHELEIISESLRLTGMLSEKNFTSMKKNVFSLFKQLTSERKERYANYLNQDKLLSAYIFYYLPWNCYKLVKLFLHLNISEVLKKFDKPELTFIDFGAGPLTVLIALWIAEPKLRAKKITWYCFDLSTKILDLGEKIFKLLANENRHNAKNWTIKKLNKKFGEIKNLKCDFYFSANMFNEFLDFNSENFFRETFNVTQIINSYLTEKAFALVVEPGNPQGGKIITNLRTHFLDKNFSILSPCTQGKNCPMQKSQIDKTKSNFNVEDSFSFAKRKWCHFSFKNSNDIKQLSAISEIVKLPKESITLSYLFVAKARINKTMEHKSFVRIRVISNIIKLPQYTFGRYACSEFGFLLLKSKNKTLIKGMHSGNIFKLPCSFFINNLHDKKTGAKVIEV